MAMYDTLKACLMFMATMALMVFSVIAGEIAIMIGIQIIDELVSRWQAWQRRKRKRF